MIRQLLSQYSKTVYLSLSGITALVIPVLSFVLVTGYGWEYHQAFWFPPVSYMLFGISAILLLIPPINLYLLVRFGFKDAPEVKSHFVNFTSFVVNLIGTLTMIGILSTYLIPIIRGA